MYCFIVDPRITTLDQGEVVCMHGTAGLIDLPNQVCVQLQYHIFCWNFGTYHKIRCSFYQDKLREALYLVIVEVQVLSPVSSDHQNNLNLLKF